MKFYSQDGKLFDTIEECKEHELILEKEAELKRRAEVEKENLWENVQKNVKVLSQSISKYEEATGDYVFVYKSNNDYMVSKADGKYIKSPINLLTGSLIDNWLK